MAFRTLFSDKNIALSLFSIFLASFSFGILIPILPFYALKYGATPLDLGLITGLWAFMGLVFSPLLGGLTDKIGRKNMLIAGMFAYVLVYSLYALADSLFIVYVARAMEGFVAAAIFPAAISVISDLSPSKYRGEAITLSAVSFSMGFVFGPAFGGIVAKHGIEYAFWLSALISVVNAFMLAKNLKEPLPRGRVHNLTQLIEEKPGTMDMLKSGLLPLFLNTMMATFVIGALEATFALFTKERLGFQAADVGFTFAIVGIMVFFSQLVSGKLAAYLGEHRLIKYGLLLSAAGFFSLYFIGNYWMMLVSLFLLVIGNAFILPNNISLITKKSDKAAVLGLNASFQNLGQIIGPVIAGFFYSVMPFLAFAAVSLVLGVWFTISATKVFQYNKK